MILKVGEPVSKEVFDQIKARQEVFSNPAKRLEYADLSGRLPFIRMCSLVMLQEGSSVAAKYGTGFNLAQNNTLGLDKGKGLTTLPGYRNYTNGLGTRPIPGITSMNITSHNRFGSVRTASVNFVCWDVQELDKFEILFMRPGHSVFLEWGFTGYIKHSTKKYTTAVHTVDPYKIISSAGDTEIAATNLWNRIYAMKGVPAADSTTNKGVSNEFNYDAIVGTIKNFSWSLRADGAYDCAVHLVTAGDLAESHKVNFYIPENTVLEDLKKASVDNIKIKGIDGNIPVDYNPLPSMTKGFYQVTSGMSNSGTTTTYTPSTSIYGSLYHDIRPEELPTDNYNGDVLKVISSNPDKSILVAYQEKFIYDVNKAIKNGITTLTEEDVKAIGGKLSLEEFRKHLTVVRPGVQVRSHRRFKTFKGGYTEVSLEYGPGGVKLNDPEDGKFNVPTARNPNIMANFLEQSFSIPSWIFTEDARDDQPILDLQVKGILTKIFKGTPYAEGFTYTLPGGGHPVGTHQQPYTGSTGRYHSRYRNSIVLESGDATNKGVATAMHIPFPDGHEKADLMYGSTDYDLGNDEAWDLPGNYIVVTFPKWDRDTALIQEATPDEEEIEEVTPKDLGVPSARYAFFSHLHYDLIVNILTKYVGAFETELTESTIPFAGGNLRSRAVDFVPADIFEPYPKTSPVTISTLIGGRFNVEDTVDYSTVVYLPLRHLLAMINKHIFKAGNEHVFQFVTDSDATYFTMPDHLSVDPSICLLPHTLGVGNFGISSDVELPNTLLNIKINIGLLIDTLNKYITSQSEATILEYLEDIFQSIEKSTGNINEFQLQYDEKSRTYTVVDRKQLGGTKYSELPELAIFGLDTTVRNLNLVSRITPKMSSMVAISAQASPFTSTEEATGFAALNKGLKDGLYVEKKDLYSKAIEAETEEEYQKKLAQQIAENVDQLKSVIFAANLAYITGIKSPDLSELVYGNYSNYLKRQLGQINNPANNFIIPYELEITLDGISGIQVMQAMRINKNVLPYTYGRKPESTIGFLITGVEHKVNTKEWLTTLRTQIYNTDESGNTVPSVIKGNLLPRILANTSGNYGPGEGSTKNLNKGWEGKEQPFRRTALTYEEAATALRAATTNKNLQKAVLAVMIKEQGRGGKIVGFNHNYGGYDITSGGWSYSTFGEEKSDGYVYAKEGGTNKRKAFVSFISAEAFCKSITSKFTDKGFQNASDESACAALWYEKWNGYGARVHWNNNKDNLKATYPTLAEYDAHVLEGFKSVYRKANTAIG